jgi:prolyl-tRNA synthetase
MGANFLDEAGRQKPLVMGCYGIGVSRLLATIIEQNYDADGIIWPKEVSPYQMIILPLDVNDKKTMDTALEAYRELEGQGVAVLLDDRDERAGVKFKDADLLGISLQLIVGKESLKNNTLELKVRRSNKKIVENKAAVFQEIRAFLNG